MTSMQCHICRMTGANNTIIDSVNQYIVENAGAVQMHEIVCQVCDVLGEHLDDAIPISKVLAGEVSHESIASHEVGLPSKRLVRSFNGSIVWLRLELQAVKDSPK